MEFLWVIPIATVGGLIFACCSDTADGVDFLFDWVFSTGAIGAVVAAGIWIFSI